MEGIAMRALLLAGFVALLLSGTATAANWPTATLAEVGIDGDLGERIDAAYGAGKLSGVHSVVVVRHGKLALERYYAGDDLRFREPIGHVVFGPDTLHDVRSVTKSVVSLLYGIALAEGVVPPPEAPLYAQFPDHAEVATPAHQAITIEHALSMTMGVAWNERVRYDSLENDASAMRQTADHVRYALDKPVIAAPGTTWDYSGGATTLVGALIARGSGVPLEQFARQHLFEPLGIERSEWTGLATGELIVSGGLRLTPRDLAKIGQLVLNRGTWEGRRVVPAAWIDRSTAAYSNARYWTFIGDRYAYQWWLGHATGGLDYILAIGYGGQRLTIVPKADLVMVVTEGNYGLRSAGRPGADLFFLHVLPSLRWP